MRYFLAFFITLLVVSCAGKKEMYDAVRKIPKQKYTPPGTVWLRDNLFIDETEVSNFSWQEYMLVQGRKEFSKYTAALPDTACWTRSDVGDPHDLINYYLRF